MIQCNFSKPNTPGTKEKVQFREVFGLERFYICTANIESRLENTFGLERVRFREVPLYYCLYI